MQVTLIGVGNVGQALLDGWILAGTEEHQFHLAVTRDVSAESLRAKYGSKFPIYVGDNATAIQHSSVILLCCKPHQVKRILSDALFIQQLSSLPTPKILVSMCAGITLQQLQDMLPVTLAITLVRGMPNTPCAKGQGCLVLAGSVPAFIFDFFSPLGYCCQVEESKFDTITALCGSGPAFACLVTESLIAGAVMTGLDTTTATLLTLNMIRGSMTMLLERNVTRAGDIAIARDAVTTPGGCTAQGLYALERGAVRAHLMEAIRVATEAARSLGVKK